MSKVNSSLVQDTIDKFEKEIKKLRDSNSKALDNLSNELSIRQADEIMLDKILDNISKSKEEDG